MGGGANGKIFERSDWQLTNTEWPPPPPPFIPEFIIFLLIKAMFGVFTFAIKFDCLFLGIFRSFHWFVRIIFDKVALPLNRCFKRCFKLLFSIPAQTTVSEKIKTWCFPYSAFWLTGQWGKGYSLPAPPPPLATLLNGILFSQIQVETCAQMHTRVKLLEGM